MKSILFYLVLYLMLQISIISGTNTSKLIGFSTYLIHRDSAQSPVYDSSVNHTDRIERALRRSKSRLSYFESILKLPNNDGAKEITNIESPIVQPDWEYLMEISIGTPPVRQLASVDTASSIVWTQCKPCIKCYPQIQPMFDSRNSSSYQLLPCNTDTCKALGEKIRCSGETRCQYYIKYLDESKTYGDLVLETFKIGSVSIPQKAYGCSNANKGLYDNASAGIIGLGAGPLSLVRQLGDLIHGKFSYCLTVWWEENAGSKISFGSNAVVSGHGVVSTPLFINRGTEHYYIALEAISVGNTIIHFKSGWENGNTMLDTGSLLTYLPRDVYQKLEDAIRRMVQVTPVESPPEDLKLCYKKVDTFKFPTITFHMSGGTRLALIERYALLPKFDLGCLTIVPTDGLYVFGSFSQMNYLFGYDLQNMRLSFRHTQCHLL